MRKPLGFILLVLAAAVAGCATSTVQSPPPAPIKLPPGATETSDLGAIAGVLAENTRKTLLVLDIDDTLLTAETFYGSDAWYEWQSKQLKDGDPRKLNCLFDLIAINTEIGTQDETQQDAYLVINPLLTRQDTLILTSRNPIARAATLRALKTEHYALPPPLANLSEGRSYRYPEGEVRDKQKTVTYDEGIFMTEGQNKGEVLKFLLRKLNLSYERVVLVDDGLGNHERMELALRGTGVEYRGLFYSRISKAVTPEKEKEAINGWREMSHLLQDVFPQRFARIAARDCAY